MDANRGVSDVRIGGTVDELHGTRPSFRTALSLHPLQEDTGEFVDHLSFAIDGREYEWSEHSGVTCRNIKIPDAVAGQILARLDKRLAESDPTVTDPFELTMRASLARKLTHLSRAEQLARRALELSPALLIAIAVLSAVLRATNRVPEALTLTDPHKNCDNTAVLTTRAPALQDAERTWEAVSLARRAWSLESQRGSHSEELRNLFARLRYEGALN
jgi:hypothetical protein